MDAYAKCAEVTERINSFQNLNVAQQSHPVQTEVYGAYTAL